MVGRFFDYVHPDDLESTEEAVARLASGQEVTKFVNRYRCRDGSYRWLEWRSAPAGNMIYAAAHDITEQRNIQEELAASETNYRNLFEQTLVGMEVIDSETGKVVLANEAMAKMFGFKGAADAVGIDPLDYIIPDDRGWVIQKMAEAYVDPQKHDVALVRSITEDGRAIWVTASGTALDYQGKPSMLVYMVDVSATKEAEIRLHESEEKNRLLIENAAEGIAVIQDGFIRFVNPKCAEFAGRTAEEMVNMPFIELVHPDDRQMLADNYERRLAGKEAANNYQFRVIDKQGNTKWLQINAGELDWEGKPATLAMLNDITERVKALEALAASEIKYRDLFEHTLLGTEVVDAETGKVVLANRSIATMFGFKSPEDMVGTSPMDYVLPEDKEWVADQMVKVFADPEKHDVVTIRARTEDGRVIWVTGSGSSFEHDGKWSMQLSLIDVTALRESEHKLREAEEKNRLIIENAAEAIVVLQDGLVKFANPKGAELIGHSGDVLTPTPFMDFIHPDDRQMMMDNHQRRMAGEEVPNNYTFRMINRRGDTMWIQINSVRLDWEGKPAVLSMLNDITDRLKAQEALAQSESSYRNLFEQTMMGMEVIDGQTGKVLLANHALASMFGFESPEDMVGIDAITGWVMPEDLGWVLREFARAMADPEKRDVATLRVKGKDGRIVWVSGSGTLFEYEGKPAVLISLIDVTALRESELKLHESEEKNRLLIDNAAEAIAVIQDGTTKFFNRRLAELTGWSAEELLKHSFLDLVHPEERETIALNYMMRIAGEEVPNNYQFRIVDKTGKTKWLQVNAVRLNWEGRPAALTMFSDVTERVMAEQAVRDSEERFRALIEKASDAVAIVDAQGQIVYYSPSIERATGYDSAGWVSRPLTDWRLHPEDMESLVPIFDGLVKEPGKIIEGLKVRYEHGDGTWHTLEATVRNLLHDPKVNGLVANFRDVTERVRAEELLRNSEERFRGLVETSSDWVWEVDRSNRYTYVSPKVRDILGYAPEELLGHTPFEFMHQREGRRVARIVRRFATESLPFSLLENTSTHKEGHSVVLETSAVPILDADGNFVGYRGIDRDITERKKVEQELQRSLKRLEKTMESTIEAITTTIETRDPYTTGHQMRVTDLACTIARTMELTPDQIEGIRVAGLLHDIGKIAIPTEILSKPGKLNEVEYEMIKTHAKVGYNILKKIEFPWPVARTVLQHHERWNGSGYPHGLRGEDILLEARILAVADVMEAMSSHRPYRPSIGGDKALDEIVSNSGILYDPTVARACLTAFTQGGFRFAPSMPAVESAGAAPADLPTHPLEDR